MKILFYVGSFIAFVLGFLMLATLHTKADLISTQSAVLDLPVFDLKSLEVIPDAQKFSKLQILQAQRQANIDYLKAIANIQDEKQK